MKKVVLLGNSIRLSYWKRVGELLSDICEIYGPEENCAYTLHAIRQAKVWFAKWGHVDLIHYNTGIWDHHRNGVDEEPLSSPEQYLYLNRRLHRYLAGRGDRLIWATSIPAGEDYDRCGTRDLLAETRAIWNDEIALYNGIVSAYLRHQGVGINDLHALVSAHPEYIGSDGIHLTDAGVEAAAQQTAEAIRKKLAEEAE